MGTYIWLNVPLALFFFGCWAGIPLWLTLTRWKDEIDAKHAELAATAAPEPVAAQRVAAQPTPAMAVAFEAAGLGYAGTEYDRAG